MTGTIFDIKEMALHDGPGIRTTVFFKGCPLHCIWCHNPEGLKKEKQLMYKESCCRHCELCRKPCNHPECQPFERCLHACPENLLSIAGRDVTAKDLAQELTKAAEPLGDTFGGFTFSGGEPMMQPDFLIALCEELKRYHLCIETSGYTDSDTYKKVISALDFVIMDMKLADSDTHKRYTGVGNERILANFEILRESGRPFLIRTPLIPKITDTKENLDAIKKIIGNSDWEQLPYNTMAGAKYKMLKMEYPLNNSTIG